MSDRGPDCYRTDYWQPQRQRDEAFQAAMRAAGVERSTCEQPGTEAPRSVTPPATSSLQSSAGWI